MFSARGLRTAPLLEGAWRPGFQRVSLTHTPTTWIITLRMGLGVLCSMCLELSLNSLEWEWETGPLGEAVRLLAQGAWSRGQKG